MEERFHTAAAACGQLAPVLQAVPSSIQLEAQEIRFRAGRPISLSLPGRTLFLTGRGDVVRTATPSCFLPSQSVLEEVFRSMCAFSVYSHQNEIRNGYVTLRGGHRAGICGTAVMDRGVMTGIRNVSSINIRIAREIRGAADGIFRRPEALTRGLLLAGPPCCGKTTVLRDLARQLSEQGKKVAVIDERGEFAGVWEGEAQNDLGPCCDILDGYPKREGMLQALRGLSPDYIVCDELGGTEDAEAVAQALCAGAVVIASVHAGRAEDLLRRPQIRALLGSGAFGSVAVMQDRTAPGTVKSWTKVGDLLENGGDFDDGCGLRVCRVGQSPSARTAG